MSKFKANLQAEPEEKESQLNQDRKLQNEKPIRMKRSKEAAHLFELISNFKEVFDEAWLKHYGELCWKKEYHMSEDLIGNTRSILNLPEISQKEWKENKCDKWDYIIAASCGALAGMVDIIFVQSPEIMQDKSGNQRASILGAQTDKLADKLIMRAGEFFYSQDSRRSIRGKKEKKPTDLSGWIAYLERAFPVPYDARYAKDLQVDKGALKGMNPKNHHLMGLSHSTDPIGLVFSIIDQFSGSGSFLDNGKVIHARPVKVNGSVPMYELQGHDLLSMLFCGFVNWVGHILSDIGGSSSTRAAGKTKRGMGVPIPFYELLLMCDVSKGDAHPFAETMIEVYEKGYDFRFGMAMAIPVILEELLVKCIWVVRQKFIRKAPWKESFPTGKHADLRIMLLVSNGVLCVLDGIDASVHGIVNKSWTSFVLHLNMIGVGRLAVLGLKEGAIRIGLMVGDEAFLEGIFARIPEKERERIQAIAQQASAFAKMLDYKAQLQIAYSDYRLAHEERIRIENECIAATDKLVSLRREMEAAVEDYMVNHLTVFTEAGDLIEDGLKSGNTDQVIRGNNMIQNKLGHAVAFSDEDEFEGLMNSEDTFTL